MSQWAYEMDNESLIREFARACAQSGTSNSGLVIDAMGSLYAEEVRYLKGVLLARLEGVKPPFKRNNIVQAKSAKEVHSTDWVRSLPSDSHQKIRRIHYDGNGKWLLEFKGIPVGERGYPQFNANDFLVSK